VLALSARAALPAQLETINGHSYLVTRDDAGGVVSMVGAEGAAVGDDRRLPVAQRTAATALLAKDPATWTLADVAGAMKILLVNTLRKD
jgi:hypothetical protein